MATIMEAEHTGTKRRRSNKHDDSDDNKKRGRPRVEKKDESAADRRRTQIRMAQRAYRQRKESTLGELRTRVNELNETVDSIESVFRDSVDRLMSLGLSEQAISELRITAARITALKASGNQSSPSYEDSDGAVEPQVTSNDTTLVQQDPLTPKNVSIWLDQTELTRPKQKMGVDDYVGLGYSIVLPETAVDQSSYSFRPQPSKPKTKQPIFTNDFLDMTKTQGLNMLTSSLPVAVKPVQVYSIQESSFARRLHRSCLEAGYLVLLDPSRNPGVYERVFKLSLLGGTRQDLIERMKFSLARGLHQPLELFNAPYVHIGGAGTHYPRRDHNGNTIKIQPSYNLGLISQSTFNRLMQGGAQRITQDVIAEVEGYEGEWLDAYDVESYLQEKGISIDPQSSFAEVDVAEIYNAESSTASSANTPERPSSSNLMRIPSFWKPLGSPEFNAADWTDAINLSDFGYTDADGGWVNLPAHPRSSPTPKPTNPSKGTATIDVAKFIKGLLHSAACLGHAPGFRRKDVDAGLAAACFDVAS